MTAAPAVDKKFWWFHTSTGHRFLVEACLFTTLGSLPSGCWFDHVFGTQATERPVPVSERDGMPVYGIGIPGQIFEEMLHGMRFPELLPTMARELPKHLGYYCDLPTWQHYLEYYLGIAIPAGKRVRDAEPADETPAAKRARFPRNVYLRRVADALATRIKAEHPKWAPFYSGIVRRLVCQFTTVDPDSSFAIPSGDVPPVDMAAFLLAIYPDEGTIFKRALAQALGFPDADIDMMRGCDPEALEWPSRSSRLNESVHLTVGFN